MAAVAFSGVELKEKRLAANGYAGTAQGATLGVYEPGEKTMYVNTENIKSESALAFILAHEGTHAYTPFELASVFYTTDPLAAAAEELTADLSAALFLHEKTHPGEPISSLPDIVCRRYASFAASVEKILEPRAQAEFMEAVYVRATLTSTFMANASKQSRAIASATVEHNFKVAQGLQHLTEQRESAKKAAFDALSDMAYGR
jgi:hypothetical protein